MTIFLSKDSLKIGEPLLLNRDKSHYLLKVMRCRVGDGLFIIDGQGGRYEGFVHGISDLRAMLIISNKIADEKPPYKTILCQSVLKGNPMDEVIQQVVELGIAEIYPTVTDRTIVRDTNKLARWRKIAEESSEQSGRSHLPIIHPPISLRGLIKIFVSERDTRGLMFLKEGGDIQQVLRDAICASHIYLLVGPEGGFTEEELSVLFKARFCAVNLGRLTLRARTAALVAVALTHYFIDQCHSRL